MQRCGASRPVSAACQCRAIDWPRSRQKEPYFHMNKVFSFATVQWQRTLAIMFVAQMIAAIGFSAMFPFLPLYVEDLGSHIEGFSTEFWSGLVISVQGFTMMIAAPLWGSIADRHGRKLMVERAMFGGGVVLFLMAFVQSSEQLVLLRAIQGMTTGTVSASNALVAASAPRERSGFAMGTLQVGLWTGVSVGPFIGGPIADAFGFHAPFLLTGVLLLVAGALVLLFVSEPEQEAPTQGKRQAGFIAGWRLVLSEPGVVQTYTIRFFTGFGRSITSPILALFLTTLLPVNAPVSTFTGLATGIASISSTVSAIYLGRLGDRIGHRKIVIGCALGAGLGYSLQALTTNPWYFLLLQVLLGASVGGLVAGPSALLARFTKPGEEGTVYGLDNSIVAAGRAVAPMAGAAIAAFFGYRGTFATSGILLFASMAVAFWTLPDIHLEVNR